MPADAVWPVALIGWNSKGKETLDAVKTGKLEVGIGKTVHVRKGARFALILEDGSVLSFGEVVGVTGYTFDLSLAACAESAESAPKLTGKWLDVIKTIPPGFLKRSVNGVVILPGKEDAVLPDAWFDDVMRFAEKRLPSTLATPRPVTQTKVPVPTPTTVSVPISEPQVAVAPPVQAVKSVVEREPLLKSWLPPRFSGLLEDHVRSDEWEMVVADAFTALGCEVDIRGCRKPGKTEPDCIATYMSSTGQGMVVIVDAKAGTWSGSVDDIRAMRDYEHVAELYAWPLFVANTLGTEVGDKLRQNPISGMKLARAICGRDLALLIVRRFSDPKFKTDEELQKLFRF